MFSKFIPWGATTMSELPPPVIGRRTAELRKPSLPVRLALLVAGTTLPLIIFATVLVLNDHAQDRKDATQRVLETVRSIRLVLDAEMQRMTGGLQVLALTNSLRNGQFDDFRRIASGFLDQYGKNGIILVADREGHQLFSSVATETADLPPRNNREIVEKVFATKRPQYSDLFVGVVKQQPIVTVEVPVMRDGEVVYDISFSPPNEIFQALIEKQRPSQDWTISMFDGQGINFARVPNPQDTVGKQAPSLLYAELLLKTEATLPIISLEGVPLDDELHALVAHRLDRRGRHRRKFAVGPAVAQSRDHQHHRRRVAAGGSRLCGQNGDHDCKG